MTIDDIFSEADDLGLLVVEPLKMHSPAGNLPLSRLEEINAFYVVHGRPPLPDSEEFKETLLAQRLRALRANKQCHDALRPFDIHGLLDDIEISRESSGSPPAPLSLLISLSWSPRWMISSLMMMGCSHFLNPIFSR
jgi:hypothetical protein